MEAALSTDFFSLSPEAVLDSVEAALAGTPHAGRATGRLQALNSVENRVYQIEFDPLSPNPLKASDQPFWLVAKFYRPGRWTAGQINEEHAFLKALHAEEVPAVVPLTLSNGQTLSATATGILFTLFPKATGRMKDELQTAEIRTLGRFIARIHGVGRTVKLSSRLTLNAKSYGWDPLNFILQSTFLSDTLKQRYENVASEALKISDQRLSQFHVQALHGDCHLGNLLWMHERPFFVDFDDCLKGPIIQDLWMTLIAHPEKAKEDLLEGYDEISQFDWSQFSLIAPLRSLRMVHYSAWIARRWTDPSFPRLFPIFGTEKYWLDEMDALARVFDHEQEVL